LPILSSDVGGEIAQKFDGLPPPPQFLTISLKGQGTFVSFFAMASTGKKKEKKKAKTTEDQLASQKLQREVESSQL
jgi:hypothetical protein